MASIWSASAEAIAGLVGTQVAPVPDVLQEEESSFETVTQEVVKTVGAA